MAAGMILSLIGRLCRVSKSFRSHEDTKLETCEWACCGCEYPLLSNEAYAFRCTFELIYSRRV